MAVLIGIRLEETVKEVEGFRDLKTYYWSDSMITLNWIKTKGLWNTFVVNRVKEIRKYSDINQWQHVPVEMNIADVLSPQWLKESEEKWPKGDVHTTEEMMKECKKVVTTNLVEF